MTRRARLPRVARAALLAIVATSGLAGLTVAPARAGGSQAVVIVETPNGTYTRVISFGGSISGLDALRLAGANPVVAASDVPGAAVCELFGVGNPATDDDTCLGGSSGVSWSYFRAPGGEGPWQYSGLGASSTTVRDGDVEGWSFGMGSPPFQSFCAVVGCAPPPAPEPEPAPAGGGSGGVAIGGTGATADDPGTAGGGPGAAGAPGATGAADPTGAEDAAPAAADMPGGTTTATTARGAGTAAERSRAAGDQALGARPTVAADDGAGSPVGVLVAVGLVALIGTTAVVVRRRRSAGPAD